jgi:hypothetical protein
MDEEFNMRDVELNPDVLRDLAHVDGIIEFLRATMNRDVIRYFDAQSDADRNMIRGAYNRTDYLLKSIRKELQ